MTNPTPTPETRENVRERFNNAFDTLYRITHELALLEDMVESVMQKRESVIELTAEGTTGLFYFFGNMKNLIKHALDEIEATGAPCVKYSPPCGNRGIK